MPGWTVNCPCDVWELNRGYHIDICIELNAVHENKTIESGSYSRQQSMGGEHIDTYFPSRDSWMILKTWGWDISVHSNRDTMFSIKSIYSDHQLVNLNSLVISNENHLLFCEKSYRIIYFTSPPMCHLCVKLTAVLHYVVFSAAISLLNFLLSFLSASRWF